MAITDPKPAMRILVAEDDSGTRVLLNRVLQSWGHEVVAVNNGAEAWEVLQKESISFVITDWVMPEMDGVELCKKIRQANFSRYIYLILLTCKNNKEELIAGMAAGADDFVVKPFNPGELNVRIRAGQRILQLEEDLQERNQKLKAAYGSVRKDLEAAAKMQKSLLPGKASVLNGIKFDWMFLPCTFVAGDIFNFFPLSEQFMGFYHLDVAGHGIPAAMLSVTLSKILSQSSPQDSPLKRAIPNTPYYEILAPAQVIYDLNQRFQDERDCMQYFTMVYGLIDLKNDSVKLSQAGHPTPLMIKNGNEVEKIGNGGFPVGMLPDMDYKNTEFKFAAGDRLILFSDGITECANPERNLFSEARLISFLQEFGDLPLNDLLSKLKEVLCHWRGSDEFEDDISILAIEK